MIWKAVSLARPGGHDQQQALLPFGDGFNSGVNGAALVVARGLAVAIVVIVLQDDPLNLWRQPFPGTVAGPEFSRSRKSIQRQRGFQLGAGPGAVMENKAVAIGGKDERDVERDGIVQRLLHPVANLVRIVLGLDQSDGPVGPVVEDVIGSLGLTPSNQLAAHDDPAFSEADLAPNLGGFVPAGACQVRRDVLRTNVAFTQELFAHAD